RGRVRHSLHDDDGKLRLRERPTLGDVALGLPDVKPSARVHVSGANGTLLLPDTEDRLRVLRILRREEAAVRLAAHRAEQAGIHRPDPVMLAGDVVLSACLVAWTNGVDQPVLGAWVHGLGAVLRAERQANNPCLGVPLRNHPPRRGYSLFEGHQRGEADAQGRQATVTQAEALPQVRQHARPGWSHVRREGSVELCPVDLHKGNLAPGFPPEQSPAVYSCGRAGGPYR